MPCSATSLSNYDLINSIAIFFAGYSSVGPKPLVRVSRLTMATVSRKDHSPLGSWPEVVLKYFDEAEKPKDVRYFRYVDDIRLFVRTEQALRHELVKLDVRSKEIGLLEVAAGPVIPRPACAQSQGSVAEVTRC